MKEITIKKGDYINEDKVLEISRDIIYENHINIRVDAYEQGYWGDVFPKVYKIRKAENE